MLELLSWRPFVLMLGVDNVKDVKPCCLKVNCVRAKTCTQTIAGDRQHSYWRTQRLSYANSTVIMAVCLALEHSSQAGNALKRNRLQMGARTLLKLGQTVKYKVFNEVRGSVRVGDLHPPVHRYIESHIDQYHRHIENISINIRT